MPGRRRGPKWAAYLRDEDAEAISRLRQRTRTGRPCGSAAFIDALEETLRRTLRPQKRGPKPKKKPKE